MKAVEQIAFGESHVLRYSDRTIPMVESGEVLVRIVAAGIDSGTVHLMQGLPLLMRPVVGFRKPRNSVPGLAFAGVVEAVGSGSSGFALGDEVFGVGKGVFAEYARAKTTSIALKPQSISFEEAAALPVSATAALHAVQDQARVKAGDSVLIIGAGGGVGTFAVQLAQSKGATVTGVCSTRKVDYLRRLGVSSIIDYQQEDFHDSDQTWGAVIDIAGNRPFETLRKATRKNGVVVFVGGDSGGKILGGMQRNLGAALQAPFRGIRAKTFFSLDNAKSLNKVADAVSAGSITPVVDRVFPLSEIVSAVDYFQSGAPCGKVIVCM